MYVGSQVCKEFLDHHYKKTAYQPNCSVPTVYLKSYGGWRKELGCGEIEHGTEEQSRKPGRHLGSIIFSLWFEAVYIAASATVQGSENDGCNKKGYLTQMAMPFL